MSGYGPTPTDGSVPPIPMSSAVSPGDRNPYPIQGGPKAVDNQNNTLVPVSLYVYDGNDVTQGTTTDPAVTGDNNGTISGKLRGLVKIFTDIWDSVNHRISINGSVGAALAPYISNPTQTAASGVDTLYKFGASGATSFTHVSGQNNTASNVYLAFDQSTTIAGNQVYTIAPGQAYAFDRSGTALHFSSPAQQSFGGLSGITVEAFA